MKNDRGHDEDSPVMNETLSVIDEHMTDMHTPRSSLLTGERAGMTDSGSEYSSHLGNRLSYIAGHETDEEERDSHSEEEVMSWTPAQVAEYLREVGVERRHCDVFREQDISGEVLLAMDQTTIFLKEFDLGLVGRRLRTWHKIKTLQEEARARPMLRRKTSGTFDGEETSDYQYQPTRSRSHSIAVSSVQGYPEEVNGDHDTLPGQHPKRDEFSRVKTTSSPQLLLQPPSTEVNSRPVPVAFDQRPGHQRRPSAASIRAFNHSRRHSSIDTPSSVTADSPRMRTGPSSPTISPTSPHKKQPSLDRNWTLNSSFTTSNGRPHSAIGGARHNTSLSSDRNTFDPTLLSSSNAVAPVGDLDRGYVSSGDAESKKTRNVLRKRDASSATHTRQNSVAEDHWRRVSLNAPKRHSRFGSVDSIRDTVAAITSPALKIYHGNSLKGRSRNSSANEAITSTRSFKGLSTPVVTKLDYEQSPNPSAAASSRRSDSEASPKPHDSPVSSVLAPKSPTKPRIGLRAISDAVTGSEKALYASPSSIPSPLKESPLHSPTRTDSTTPSRISQSLDLENTDTPYKGTNGAPVTLTPNNGTSRRKAKKETSAYTRGLEKKTPKDQMTGCDYSGWMKKKSSNIMTTWKPRLFVLRGRRLSYYYSETDSHEKGLIDISSHRVLPADHDLLTGLHATVTGAKTSPISPAGAHTPTLASTEAAAQPESTLQKANTDTMFIFKLVPPRAGLSRAVNFTKPTVHYFAVENIVQGRLWMAALMKATIDRDETKPITTTYQQKTISLIKARAMRHRPPALMGLDEKMESVVKGPRSDETGLNIRGLDFDGENTGVEDRGILKSEPDSTIPEMTIN